MSALTKRVKTNTSGCIGVSMLKRKLTLKGGVVVVRRWWSAQCGKAVRRFSIDALGNRAAYHEAVRARAEWVRQQAPVEIARKKAKSRRNATTYRQRYPEKNRQRHRDHLTKNRVHINAQRRARAKQKGAK